MPEDTWCKWCCYVSWKVRWQANGDRLTIGTWGCVKMRIVDTHTHTHTHAHTHTHTACMQCTWLTIAVCGVLLVLDGLQCHPLDRELVRRGHVVIAVILGQCSWHPKITNYAAQTIPHQHIPNNPQRIGTTCIQALLKCVLCPSPTNNFHLSLSKSPRLLSLWMLPQFKNQWFVLVWPHVSLPMLLIHPLTPTLPLALRYCTLIHPLKSLSLCVTLLYLLTSG